MNTEGKYIANKRVKHPYSWAKTTVYQILSNPVYLGKLVSQRYTTRSFKDKRIVERPPEEWVIVENTHEPLVDQATFDTVQERIKIKQPATWTNTDNMFRGLMICGGRNTRMVFTTRKKSQIERLLQLQYAPASTAAMASTSGRALPSPSTTATITAAVLLCRFRRVRWSSMAAPLPVSHSAIRMAATS